MMHSEFEALIDETIEANDYTKVETVYMYYPGFNCKQQVADTYKLHGVVIFKDLYPRAEEIMNTECSLAALQSKLNGLNGKD